MNPKCKFALISLHFIFVDLNDATKKQAKSLVFSKEAHKLYQISTCSFRKPKKKSCAKQVQS
jgi:hypothetical protein